MKFLYEKNKHGIADVAPGIHDENILSNNAQDDAGRDEIENPYNVLNSCCQCNSDTSTPVNHPAHYNAHSSGVECITIAEGFNFNIGNAIKYIWRAGLKNDNAIQDLNKAAWYLQREIERMTKQRAASEGITSCP